MQRPPTGEYGGVALAIVAIGVVFAILYFARAFFITSLAAVIIAFILEPFVTLLMRFRMPRALASALVCAVALLGVYLAGMGAYSQAAGLLDELPKYGERIGELVESVQQKVESVEDKAAMVLMPSAVRRREMERIQAEQKRQAELQAKRRRRNEPPPVPVGPQPPETTIPEVRIHEERSPITEYFYARLASVYQFLLMASREPARIFTWIAALTLAMAATTLVLAAADRLQRLLGERGMIALERLMGLVLTALAVEMLLAGLRTFAAQLGR
jgi:hypothetical protein